MILLPASHAVAGCFFELADPLERPPPATLVPEGATWRYLDTGSFESGWEQPGFDDSSWASGPAELGYGPEETPATVVNGGPDNQHFITTYFRHEFTVQRAVGIRSVKLGVVRDDGVVVYLNGMEVFRDNLPTGPVSPNTPSLTGISGDAESTWVESAVEPRLLVEGANVIAAEIHQDGPSSTDIRFNLRLESGR